MVASLIACMQKNGEKPPHAKVRVPALLISPVQIFFLLIEFNCATVNVRLIFLILLQIRDVT